MANGIAVSYNCTTCSDTRTDLAFTLDQAERLEQCVKALGGYAQFSKDGKRLKVSGPCVKCNPES